MVQRRDKHPPLSLLCLVTVTCLGIGCGEVDEQDAMSVENTPTPASGKGDIYGEDDRAELASVAIDSMEWRLAQGSAALVDRTKLTEGAGADGGYGLSASVQSLGAQYDLCDGERFADQPILAHCSATLVAPDLIATSAHCLGGEGATADQITASRCQEIQIVFGFAYSEQDQAGFEPFADIPGDNVYGCERVEALRLGSAPENEDWALIRLDRPVVDREPLPILGHMPAQQAPLVQIGHPSGVPQKIALGLVTDGFASTDWADETEGNTFAYDADLLGGNSGGGVFDMEFEALAGMPTLYSGRNYVVGPTGQCSVAGVCGVNATCPLPPGAYATSHMIDKLADSAPQLLSELTIVERPCEGQDCDTSALVISEVLANARGIDANNDGEADSTDDEFVEIVNISMESVDVQGHTLSDDRGVLMTLPSIVLEPGQRLVVFGGGAPNLDGVLTHVDGPLNLSNMGDTVTLTDGRGRALDVLSYERAPEGTSLVRVELEPNSATSRHDGVYDEAISPGE